MRALAVAAAALVAAGCGGAKSTERGRAIFVQQCAGCHTLTGKEHGAPGGDLAIPHLAERDVASFARVMPTSHRLSAAEAAAVARYVVATRRRG